MLKVAIPNKGSLSDSAIAALKKLVIASAQMQEI